MWSKRACHSPGFLLLARWRCFRYQSCTRARCPFLAKETEARSWQNSLPAAPISLLTNRRVDVLIDRWFDDQILGDMSAVQCGDVAMRLQAWPFRPGGTEGYRTAEVTPGGLATTGFSSKTFEAKGYPGLYVIGEALDITGWLGGYNFQWAWARGYCCAEQLQRLKVA